jgi:hypothetical protein
VEQTAHRWAFFIFEFFQKIDIIKIEINFLVLIKRKYFNYGVY